MRAGIISSARRRTPAPQIEQFASDGGTFPVYAQATWPSGFRDSANNVTYLMREAYLGGYRLHRIVSYDHDTATWGEEYTCGVSDLIDNDHGVPAGFRDGAGYLHWFGGAHASQLYHQHTIAADDISRWSAKQTVGSNSYTYPHPVYDGSNLYLFVRRTVTTSPRKDTLVLLKSTAIAAGVISYAAEVSLVDFGNDSRFYLGFVHDDGTDIHLLATFADGADAYRRHIYHFRYEKSSGNLKNSDGTRTDSTLPISLATADSYYRIVTQTNDTSLPTGCVDASGRLHLAYYDGSGTTWTVEHKVRMGTAWGGAATALTPASGNRYEFPALCPLADGRVEVYAASDPGNTFSRNGSTLLRAVWDGAWGSPDTIFTATGAKAIGEPSQIYNASPELRLTFHENAADSNNSSAGTAKSYAVGTDITPRTIPTVDDDVALQLSFDGADAATTTHDESIFQPYRIPVFSGNAQLDTAQAKFGASSLLLDGSGDYICPVYGSGLDVNNATDKTYEAWIRVSAFDTGDNQTIMDTRGATTLAARGFTFAINNTTKRLDFAAWNGSGAVVINLAGTNALSTGAWYHVAATRAGTTWRLFLNGGVEATGTQTGTPVAAGEAFNIGRSGVSATPRYFKGWIDEVRVLHGRAEYTAAFTPPSSAFPRP